METLKTKLIEGLELELFRNDEEKYWGVEYKDDIVCFDFAETNGYDNAVEYFENFKA